MLPIENISKTAPSNIISIMINKITNSTKQISPYFDKKISILLDFGVSVAGYNETGFIIPPPPY